MTTAAYAPLAPRGPLARRRLRVDGAWTLFLLVFAAQAAFGIWMASRGFRWGDGFYRSTSALSVLYSADPKLANIGFVWMPLPALLNLPWVALYPLWNDVVSSGAASALTSAVCGGATAAILLVTSRALGLSSLLGGAFALLVSVQPMIFLYAGTGMSEGVVAPFAVGSVCCLTLFWRSGDRWWIAAAGVSLALAVAAAYQAVPLGAALLAALVLGLLWGREPRPSAPQGRLRAVEGLGLLLLVPAVFTGVLWIGANAVIMGDPFFFIDGAYGYASYQGEAFVGGVPSVEGDARAVIALLAPRTWPFLVPLVALLAVRALDRRLLRVETLALLVLALSVSVAMVAPMAYLGSRMDFLRYHEFPLLVAAGWSLYEIAVSARRRRATVAVFASWALALPASLAVIVNPSLAPQEYPPLKALVEGKDALAMGYGDPVVTRQGIASFLDDGVLEDGRRVLLDSYQGAAIAAQVRPGHADLLTMTFDDRFEAALADPRRGGIEFVLMPDPASWPQDALNRARPRLWSGREPGFRLVKRFDAGSAFQLPENWRLFAVERGAPVLPTADGGPR